MWTLRSPMCSVLFRDCGLLRCCPSRLQGGICAVLDASDSVDAHVHDTMVAGAWLNDRKWVATPKQGSHQRSHV